MCFTTSMEGKMSKYDFKLDIYGDNTIAWVADRVEENSRVLEFGPANGRLTKYLSFDKKCKVDIVEIDEESGKDAKKYAVNALVGAEKGNIEAYYWMELDEKYDYIIFADVLEHLVNPDEVLKHCCKKIKDNGKIIVSVPNIAHNSVIIDLINDKFNYNLTGILDNTHLRFFTRESFGDMAAKTGWTIVEERSKQIRAGETEIANSYNDVSKEIFKELIHRENGNVYQFFFVLAQSSDYLLGKCERRVSLDSASYYYAEILYENEGKYDYKLSANRHFDPYYGKLEVDFKNDEDCRSVIIKPINCNCVLRNIVIEVGYGKKREVIDCFEHNGDVIDECYYFMDKIPELKVILPDGVLDISIKLDILKYDFDDEIFLKIFNRLKHELNHIVQICDDYERELSRVNNEIEVLKASSDKIEHIENIENKLSKSTKAIGNRIFKKKIKVKELNNKQAYAGSVKPVTAVIPNYNYARYLVERMDSIVFQTYPVEKIVIIDDCSTDNSVEVIENYIKGRKTDIPIVLVQNQENSGSVFAQWKKAFQLAKSEYVWIAEADDSCNERFLETVMKGFDDKEVVISYCESLTIDENNNLLMGDLRVWIDIFNTGKWNQDYVNDGKREVAESMCINNTIANVSSAVIRKGDYDSIFEKAKEFKLAGDWYSYMNILQNGKIAYFKESLNYHRMQKQGLTLSTSHEEEYNEIVKLQDFALDNFEVSEETKKKVYDRRERERLRFGL